MLGIKARHSLLTFHPLPVMCSESVQRCVYSSLIAGVNETEGRVTFGAVVSVHSGSNSAADVGQTHRQDRGCLLNQFDSVLAGM